MSENYRTVEFPDGKGYTRHGSPLFYELLEKMAETHSRKSHDYASNDNPYGNYHFAGLVANLFAHSSEDAGFVGRIAEKIYRLSNLEKDGQIAKNESVEDTEIDIVTICALWMADRKHRRSVYQGEQTNQVSVNFTEKQSEDAACQMISLAQKLNVRHMKEFRDYLNSCLRDIKEN